MNETNPSPTEGTGMLDEILTAPTAPAVPTTPVSDPLSTVTVEVSPAPTPAPTPISMPTQEAPASNSLESLLNTVPTPPVETPVPVGISVPTEAPAIQTETPLMQTEPSMVPPIPPTPPKKKVPMKPADFLKIVGALFMVALIFFGSFLAYIVFNPGQAKFFIQFGINPSDIATLLERLVNGIFWSLTFFVSVVWAIFIFRAFITKKEYKRKKTIAIIWAVFFGAILFSNLSFWAFLVQKIGAQDFVNPNGGVVIYDNDRLLSERFKNSSEMSDFNNLVGPVTLKFDLDSDARYASKFMDIESFEVDFDGDGSIDKEGTNPREAKDLIFTYDAKGKFSPKGSYVGKDAITRDPKTMSILLPVINVSAVVTITPSKKGTAYDATDAVKLGNPKWYEGEDLNVPVSSDPIYVAKPSKEERFLCLALENALAKNESCNKIFVIKTGTDDAVTAKIVIERVKEDDPLSYRIKLEDVKVRNGGEIADYRWSLKGGTVFCREEECDWTFAEYGKQTITAKVTDAAKNSVEITEEFTINRPLQLLRGASNEPLLKVTEEGGENLLVNSFDSSLEAYQIEKTIVVPTKLTFDARDVRVKNPGYELDSVEWDFGGKEQKSGDHLEYEVSKEGRLEVIAKYVFLHRASEDRLEVQERILFEAEKKDLAAQMTFVQESEYAPSTIKFDGSASRTKEGTITKFIYDFGAGKPPAEGDAIQTYRYDSPGEYTVTFTVVKDDGSKDSVSRKIVLKDLPKSLKINTSVSSGIVGKGIDFDVFGSTGQIESYSWDFGDSTSPSTDPTPAHTYETAGTYTVKLQVRYADGTLRNAEKEVVVK